MYLDASLILQYSYFHIACFLRLSEMNIEQDRIPFLVNFAETRSAAPSIGGYYCETRHMWIDDKSNTPMIEFGGIAELSTKTNSARETDDELSFANELQTKTFVQTESDDTSIHCKHLVELMTKTKVEQESDDTCYEF